MSKLAKKGEWKPLFSGTEPKTVVKAQRQFCMTELENGAKKLAEMEGVLQKMQMEFAEIEKKYRQYEENYHYMRGPEAVIVSFKEYEYIRIQYRDFGGKYEAMNAQLEDARAKVDAARAAVENMRKNVLYLDEALRREGKVVELNGYKRRKGIEVTYPE